MASDSTARLPLEGRRILLGITGSIAAYKAAVLCRLLKTAGAEVRVVMTPLAKQFITPLTMATLSKNPILVEFFDIQEEIQQDLLTADEKTAEMLGDYVDMMSRTFKHYGVQIEQVNVGDAYDPRIHQPVKAVETDRPELDKTIAKTRKALVHSIDGKVEERARVHVYQYKAPKPAES